MNSTVLRQTGRHVKAKQAAVASTAQGEWLCSRRATSTLASI